MNKHWLTVWVILMIGAIMSLNCAIADQSEGLSIPQWTAGDYWSYDIVMENTTATDYTFTVNGKETITVNSQSYEVYAVHMTATISMTSQNTTVTMHLDGIEYFTVDKLAIVKMTETETVTTDIPYTQTVTDLETIYLTPYDNMQFPINVGETWHAESNKTTRSTTNGNTTTDNYMESSDLMCTEMKTLTIGDKSYETYVIKEQSSTSDPYYTLIYVSSSVGYMVQQDSYSPQDGLKTMFVLKSYKYSTGEGGILETNIGGIPVIIIPVIIIIVIVVIVVSVVLKRRKKTAAPQPAQQSYPIQVVPQVQYIVIHQPQVTETPAVQQPQVIPAPVVQQPQVMEIPVVQQTQVMPAPIVQQEQVAPVPVVQQELCPQCSKEVLPEYISCPYCGANLPRPLYCPKCGKNIDAEYNVCPYCQENLKR